MNTQQAYNAWALQYDTSINKTRDLEAFALRNTLEKINIRYCLEIGCGTGKNTLWFAEKATHTTAVDLSEEMLARAKEKICSEKVEFVHADITAEWTFKKKLYDLISFSLVLEHIDDLESIFRKISASVTKGGYVYIGELHPFKQYNGSKARFETETGTQIVPCFNHHLSDFLLPAKKYGLAVADINEYFDDDDRNEIPRILTILLQKT